VGAIRNLPLLAAMEGRFRVPAPEAGAGPGMTGYGDPLPPVLRTHNTLVTPGMTRNQDSLLMLHAENMFVIPDEPMQWARSGMTGHEDSSGQHT
jgi:hypothetical protein